MTVYITHAKRTAIGNFMGGLRDIPAARLGEQVIRALLEESKLDPVSISEVIMGQVLTGGAGQNPARQASIFAGVPYAVPGTTINQVCGSGLKSVILAYESMGRNSIVIAGGQESMSMSMHASYIRSGLKMGDQKFHDTILLDGLTDAFSMKHMGLTAENISKKFNIMREEQDEFALLSQQKASNARKSAKFSREIIAVHTRNGILNHDEYIREDTSMEKLGKLSPAFDKNGTVTAGNASGINDGAAAVIVASERAIKEHNLRPIARIVSYAQAGVDPEFMGMGPVPATNLALAIAGWKVDDLDLIECNEAFAVQSIYTIRQLGLDMAKVNVHGGGIALGHPIGASGARILVTLLHALQDIGGRKGLVNLCIGGGMGIAMCVEMCDL